MAVDSMGGGGTSLAGVLWRIHQIVSVLPICHLPDTFTMSHRADGTSTAFGLKKSTLFQAPVPAPMPTPTPVPTPASYLRLTVDSA